MKKEFKIKFNDWEYENILTPLIGVTNNNREQAENAQRNFMEIILRQIVYQLEKKIKDEPTKKFIDVNYYSLDKDGSYSICYTEKTDNKENK